MGLRKRWHSAIAEPVPPSLPPFIVSQNIYISPALCWQASCQSFQVIPSHFKPKSSRNPAEIQGKTSMGLRNLAVTRQRDGIYAVAQLPPTLITRINIRNPARNGWEWESQVINRLVDIEYSFENPLGLRYQIQEKEMEEEARTVAEPHWMVKTKITLKSNLESIGNYFSHGFCDANELWLLTKSLLSLETTLSGYATVKSAHRSFFSGRAHLKHHFLLRNDELFGQTLSTNKQTV